MYVKISGSILSDVRVRYKLTDSETIQITHITGEDDDADATIYIKKLNEVGITDISQVEYFTLSFHVADYEVSDGNYSGGYSAH